MLREEAERLLRPGGADRLFARYEDYSGLLVAVSGGPDSMALLLLARAWAQSARRPRLFAATVDHGLRQASRSEAEATAGWCRAMGVPHRLLIWEATKPSARLQERAREARYALLEACARDLGAAALLTAHHADDQAETVLFRLLRGSGVAGLAGMSEIAWRGGLAHGRPLLGLTKADLMAICAAADQPFIEDPSNLDPRFARTGLRRAAALLQEWGFGRDGVLRLARRAARADAALARSARALAIEAFVRRDENSSSLRAPLLAQAPEELSLRLVCEEIMRISGRSTLRLDRAEALTVRLLSAIASDSPFSATLGGIVLRSKKGTVTFTKEKTRAGRNADLRLEQIRRRL